MIPTPEQEIARLQRAVSALTNMVACLAECLNYSMVHGDEETSLNRLSRARNGIGIVLEHLYPPHIQAQNRQAAISSHEETQD